jgi:hypothetical protein
MSVHVAMRWIEAKKSNKALAAAEWSHPTSLQVLPSKDGQSIAVAVAVHAHGVGTRLDDIGAGFRSRFCRDAAAYSGDSGQAIPRTSSKPHSVASLSKT